MDMIKDNSPQAVDGIVWISLPAGLNRSLGGFPVNPDIMLPVDSGGDAEHWTAERLSVESVIAGMLKVLARFPDSPDAAYYRNFVLSVRPGIMNELSEAAILKAKNRDFEIAEEIFLALAGLFPDAPEHALNLAVSYEDRADAYAKIGKEDLAETYTEKAFALYRKLTASKPPFPDVFFNSGFFHLKRRNFERARDLFHKYLRLDSGNAEKRARAKEIVMKLDGQEYLDTLFREAYDFIAMGKETEGIERVSEFLEQYPKVWNAWFLLGWAYRRLSRWEEGKEALEKACEFGGGDPDTLNELSICLLELGDFTGAKRKLETALYKEPENVKVITNLGIVALKQGKTREAEGFFRTALEIEPEDPVAKAYLAGTE